MSELSRMFDSTVIGPDRAALAGAFDSTPPAEALPPIPAGEYAARWLDGTLGESRTGTPFYRARFEIASGEHAGRRLVHRWYLSPKALPYSRRDLAALGFDSFAKLQSGAAPRGLVRLHVALRREDSGAVSNEIREVIPGGPEPDPREVSAAPAPVTPVPIEPEPATPARVEDLPAGLVDSDLI